MVWYGLQGQCSGHGVLKLPNGEQYEGDFQGDFFHGRGTYTYATGDRYVGEWRRGSKHGQGTTYNADGTVKTVALTGQWQDGRYVVVDSTIDMQVMTGAGTAGVADDKDPGTSTAAKDQ